MKTWRNLLPENFNDFLCLILISLIAALWILDGRKSIELNPEVLGSSIAAFILLTQFYFRKKSGGD